MFASFSLQQSQQVDAKISEIEAEMQEHYLVTKQLEKVEGGRTCTSRFCRTPFQIERSTFHSYGLGRRACVIAALWQPHRRRPARTGLGCV